VCKQGVEMAGKKNEENWWEMNMERLAGEVSCCEHPAIGNLPHPHKEKGNHHKRSSWDKGKRQIKLDHHR